jgi:pimeloyl-ACP methyl ester carboxylesterase
VAFASETATNNNRTAGDIVAETTVSLKVTGREVATTLPPLLRPPSFRSDRQIEDPFLPRSYLRATGSFDVGASVRAAPDGIVEMRRDAKLDEIIVLELSDGSALITSAGRLRESLQRTHPELLGPDDEILLEKLRDQGSVERSGFGDAIGGLINRVFTLVAGETTDAILDAALEKLKELAGDKLATVAELGVTWAGTKALMWAIENRLEQHPGLYRWEGAAELTPLDDRFSKKVPIDPTRGQEPAPMLIFLHGTGSSTFGSFGDLRNDDRDVWVVLKSRFTGGIYAFEHHTLSQSPIDNALQLVKTLPVGAHISLVSHSRGGLVADLLCLTDFDELIKGFSYDFEGTGDEDPAESQRVIEELKTAHKEHRAQLRELAAELRARKLVVQRYVRVASPANGTKLISGNLDVFLSGLLTLIGQVPFLFGNPVYSAIKRVVVEIVKNRTNAHLVPGIEAQLPDSPMAQFLRDAPVRSGVEMSVIAGDIEGGNLLKRLGVLLTDFLLFENEANDLVVDTAAMLAGVATKAKARVLFDRGADVSHFRYFGNFDTRVALRDWLIADTLSAVEGFSELPGPGEFETALAAATRDTTSDERPVVVVLPGVMGSHLKIRDKGRVWFDPSDIAAGGLTKIKWGKADVEADELFALSYGKLCNTLARSHRVERFAYDWRQPLDVLADQLSSFLDGLMKETQQPIRLLAHSMGGLVVRACIHKHRSVMDELMLRQGARLVMLGTPNQGSHSMVENLLGKGNTLRTLVRLDLKHDMQEVLDIVAGFRGALQLLPKPGFIDTFQGQTDGGSIYEFQKAQTWIDFKVVVRDVWFGDQRCGTPSQPILDAASWLWAQDGSRKPSLPEAYKNKCLYVFGIAPNTPCGVRQETDRHGNVRLKMVGTTHGDGTVTWESGRIDGVGSYYYMPAVHGDLAATAEYFPAIVDLLTSGETARLSTTPPTTRAVEQSLPVSYDAGPPTIDDTTTIERGLMGGSLHNRMRTRPKRRLEVAVKAEDLRFLSMPIMVGHYEQDPIAGPQALIDRELLDHDLSERHSLGLYAGACGTATVVLYAPNEFERARGSLRGAIVTGLGKYDGALSLQNLTEAVRTGVLRYLLQVVDVLGKSDHELSLATLLIGYNSSANLTVSASVEALVSGVLDANTKFRETTRRNIRVAQLDIVELYLDTAITAVYALRQLEQRLVERATAQDTTLVIRRELEQGKGMRQRLFDDRNSSYWPRLIVTDADRDDARHSPEGDEREPARDEGAAVNGSGSPRAKSSSPGTGVANRLRFLYVGQRARAESVIQQRQPGLIEKLVRGQIGVKVWQPDFGRMLFQLMVPPDFKDAARQLERLVLVVDSTTANLPWELMLADDPTRPDRDQRPLALRAAMVRQLSSTRFRTQVRQVIGRKALVIGNPSVEGFGANFIGPDDKPLKDPVDLPNGQAEAEAIVNLLTGMGYDVGLPIIGNDRTASDVLAALYRQPYRILHISAHGVYNQRHRDKRLRSGIVLSDGMLITAAEINAMEMVPELVFLSCCHLGQVDIRRDSGQVDIWRDGNLLAASVARELIEIGVRCVIVAGWAVNDEYAKLFGLAFYEHLLQQHRTFGEAVHEARVALWKKHPEDITWGAFQAYGDAGWRAEPRGDGSQRNDGDLYASPDELLDDLARTRADLSRKRERQSESEVRAQAKAINQKLKKRCPASWLALPQLQSALGATWYDLGQFEQAREAYLKAVQAEDKVGRVPIRDIEQLANIEARLGDQLADQEFKAGARADESEARATPTNKPTSKETALGLVELALKRLDGLDKILVTTLDGDGAAPVPTTERSALRGSALKRKAAVYARQILAGATSETDMAMKQERMTDALKKAVKAYERAAGGADSGHFLPYQALNKLALEALTPWDNSEHKNQAIADTEKCRKDAAQSYAQSRDTWNAIMQAEALLVARMLDGTFGDADERGKNAFNEIARAYSEATVNVTLQPSQLDSMLTQFKLLRLCHKALAVADNDTSRERIAERLDDLAQRLRPGRRHRT